MKKQGAEKATVWAAIRGHSVLMTSIRINEVICFKQKREEGEREGEEELIRSQNQTK